MRISAEGMALAMALRRVEAGIPELGPADVQRRCREEPGKAGLVVLVRGHRWPELDQAVMEVARRYPQALWAGRIDVALFPKLVGDYVGRTGARREDVMQSLPAVGIIRDGELHMTMRPEPLFARGRLQVASLVSQVDAFAYKMAVTFTPKPKKAVGEPKAEINRDKPVAVKITKGGKAFNLTLYEGENLLDGALERGVELDYSCKQGKCDTCTVRVLKGGENLAEPTEGERQVLGEQIAQGLRLSCQVIVKGPVEIEQ